MGNLYHRTIEIQLSANVEDDEIAEKILDELVEKIKNLDDAYYEHYTLSIWDLSVGEIACKAHRKAGGADLYAEDAYDTMKEECKRGRKRR